MGLIEQELSKSGLFVPTPQGYVLKDAWVPANAHPILKAWRPTTELGLAVASVLHHLPKDLALELLDRMRSCAVIESTLALVHIRGMHADHPFRVDDYGIVRRKLVTDNGVALIVDALDNTLADATIKYHGVGTGTNAENATDSALQTESTTALNPDNTRATGTFSQPAANQSRSVATNTFDAGAAITEHGVLSQAAVGGGTLLDRSVFSAINVVSADSLQSTYTLTVTSGG